MSAWLIWLIVAVGLLVAEIFSLDLVLVMFASGALAAAVAAGVGSPLLVQALVFALVSVASLVVARPLAKRRLEVAQDPVKHGIDAIRGADALVLEQVDEHHGLVKIGGEQWTARAFDGTQVIEPGQKVQVVEVKGATALVWRQP
ncbi:NfeD family protein [Cryptosporangium aurantiacum]|uniref:Membrane protein implicated in regulation of membrane protease activity n=1 Tax=Cryptosporangium aurantiacum TaxID=134849 RepID=A0A1M7JCE8_9ACTN|nr:NfeD family protein [Cryptosporangium aurantiacum]SHM50686.1 Membrane protein implicated in regulation of membrane protease activity [Cryptosporangium aurantiacum]